MEKTIKPGEYPTPDKQYESNYKYETYESLQTGAMGKVTK